LPCAASVGGRMLFYKVRASISVPDQLHVVFINAVIGGHDRGTVRGVLSVVGLEAFGVVDSSVVIW